MGEAPGEGGPEWRGVVLGLVLQARAKPPNGFFHAVLWLYSGSLGTLARPVYSRNTHITFLLVRSLIPDLPFGDLSLSKCLTDTSDSVQN